jgi:hypothetical protein
MAVTSDGKSVSTEADFIGTYLDTFFAAYKEAGLNDVDVSVKSPLPAPVDYGLRSTRDPRREHYVDYEMVIARYLSFHYDFIDKIRIKSNTTYYFSCFIPCRFLLTAYCHLL